EHRPVAERSIVLSVERSRELLKDDFLRTGEGHVADALREFGVVAMVPEVVSARLRALMDQGRLRGRRVDVLLHPRPDVSQQQDRRSTGESAIHDAVEIRKVATGIADLDSIVNGGFPSGSTILLLGDIGAGMQEYIYTAASKTALVHERPEARRYYLGDHCDDSELPERVCYVTFSRSKEIILQELATSFNGEYYRAFRDRTVFKDFSAAYFRHSAVPATWTHQEDPFDLPSTNLLEELIAFLDENARD